MLSGPGNMDSIKKAAGEGAIQGGVKGAMKRITLAEFGWKLKPQGM